ncbi:Glutamyl-tRNA(Gln) amidotransferase subunit A-like protein [Tolypocladium paradoxum]|uniref:Glutamyl-tRNA(Gln) amidotransferase subunit A-like protein n=1 Tax=Tolypocladium paradoxum TaxID=94208 RepID=A0A2S4L797_9HYPO|nr:Glutamyl-tRNA(Gln) amidotransferase subunit A-like protein [Tolypocladium paradoxum]
MAGINLVEASIEDLQHALSSGSVTSVELVARYLRRISTYDCRNVALNAIPVLNNAIFEEAAASDDRRASGAHPRPLEGIPYTIKDSFKVKGMAAAAASPAFKNLIANEDAFLVQTIRDAGAVLVGRTNMPAMACGGMQRGIWGRAENPYNPEYLAAAFASGSSNGSAVSTAASFAAFGIGAETVSSGRSPASNNALVAYTPSRGWLSIRGNWPLYPTCDVPVPHTRTMMDLLSLLDVIVVEDPVQKGEFWNEQSFVQLPKPWMNRPYSFKEISSFKSLSGMRIAVPEMFLGRPAPEEAREVETSPAVIELWDQARKDLESLGAEIVLVPDFPPLTAYENDELLPEGCPRRTKDWNAMERGALIAHAWNDFLKGFNDSELPDLVAVDPFNIYPDYLRTEPELRHFERANAIQYHKLAEYINTTTLYGIAGLEEAVKALEGMRKVLLEDWLSDLGCDFVAFPAAGDVGPASADSSFEGAALAWRNGTYYSNGNRAMRHLGIPSVSVPMGIMSDKGVPVNLTFAGRAFDDVQLLRWANAFEAKTMHRVPPPRTPALDSDVILPSGSKLSSDSPRPRVAIEKFEAAPEKDAAPDTSLRVNIQGLVTLAAPAVEPPELEVTIDGFAVPFENIAIELQPRNSAGGTVFSFEIKVVTPKPIGRKGLECTWAPVARDKTMAVILARASPGGRPTGWLGLL